jgi:hypothetical protein
VECRAGDSRYPPNVDDFVEQRWERVIAVTKWLGIVLAAVAAYDVYDGDDVRGMVMTVAPAAACLVTWRLAQARLDRLQSGERGGWLGWAATGMCVAVGTVGIALAVLGTLTSADERDRRQAGDPPRPQQVRIPDDVVEMDCPMRLADGQVHTVRTLTRGRCGPVDGPGGSSPSPSH